MTAQAETKCEAQANLCVLDRGKLADLEALIGKERSAVALGRFKKELVEHIAVIAAPTTAAEEQAARAHKLVGIAGTFGLQELSEQSRIFEEASKSGANDLEPLRESLLAAARRAKDELDGL